MSARGGSRALFIDSSSSTPRWTLEFSKIKENFPQFELKSSRGSDRVTAVEGVLTNDGRRYGIRIEIPQDYPYVIPKIVPQGWDPGGSPHRYNDGTLCVMNPPEWGKAYSIAYMIAKSAVWIAKWKKWNQTGYWPGHQDD
ncbi:MAG: ubiquitin-conjugating enzyme E2 variant [Candidatus Thorarchaeota archaeon]